MSIPNTPSQADIDRLSVAELEAFPLPLLRDLQDALDADADTLKARRAKLGAALDNLFAERAQQERLAASKDSGRVNLPDAASGLIVQCDAKKSVKWDQDKLAEIAQRIASHGENPATYMHIKYEVRETLYKDWPADVRKAFDEARTVSVSTSYNIKEPKK